jgi:hypothetical protein
MISSTVVGYLFVQQKILMYTSPIKNREEDIVLLGCYAVSELWLPTFRKVKEPDIPEDLNHQQDPSLYASQMSQE